MNVFIWNRRFSKVQKKNTKVTLLLFHIPFFLFDRLSDLWSCDMDAVKERDDEVKGLSLIDVCFEDDSLISQSSGLVVVVVFIFIFGSNQQILVLYEFIHHNFDFDICSLFWTNAQGFECLFRDIKLIGDLFLLGEI